MRRLPPLNALRVFEVAAHFFVTRQAVMDDLRLGIGPLPVLQMDVAAGNLVTPFPAISVPRKSYLALIPFDADKTSSLTRFLDWLIAEGMDAKDASSNLNHGSSHLAGRGRDVN